MRTPWRELKDAEVEALRWRRGGEIPPKIASRLRKLLNVCHKDAEAAECICYHGSLALLHERDRDWLRAMKHRKTEISLIERLHRLMAKEPPSLRRFATQNYRAADLQERRRILKQLTQKHVNHPLHPTAAPGALGESEHLGRASVGERKR